MAAGGTVRPKLTVPYDPTGADDTGEIWEPIDTIDMKFVGDYTGLTLAQVENLSILEFFLYLHDAVVWRLSETEKGRTYLENAARLRITEPDVRGLPVAKEEG